MNSFGFFAYLQRIFSRSIIVPTVATSLEQQRQGYTPLTKTAFPLKQRKFWL